MNTRLEIPATAIRVNVSDEVAQQFADVANVFQMQNGVCRRTDCIVGQRPHGIARAVRELHLQPVDAKGVPRRAKRRSPERPQSPLDRLPRPESQATDLP